MVQHIHTNPRAPRRMQCTPQAPHHMYHTRPAAVHTVVAKLHSSFTTPFGFAPNQVKVFANHNSYQCTAASTLGSQKVC